MDPAAGTSPAGRTDRPLEAGPAVEVPDPDHFVLAGREEAGTIGREDQRADWPVMAGVVDEQEGLEEGLRESRSRVRVLRALRGRGGRVDGPDRPADSRLDLHRLLADPGAAARHHDPMTAGPEPDFLASGPG